MDPHRTPRIILRDASDGEWLIFENPGKVIVASRSDEIIPALEEIQRLVDRKGWHAAGFVSYEAAPAFDEAYSTHPIGEYPLLLFGLYAKPHRSRNLPSGDGNYKLGAWTPTITQRDYDGAVAQIKNHIARGETYQVNYTFRLRSVFTGDPWGIFVDMLNAQPVGYPAFIDAGRHIICSTSPELFFRLEGQRITCRPMKGTAGRGRTLPEDDSQAEWLRTSEKNRAENVMIVDMIRNDLGRVAETGTVRVPELFNTERYRTLWQMTSTVCAQVKAPFVDIVSALFPCASITGAPKVSTMRIISALETVPRHLYTGTIGFLSPGRQAQFNVAIRTLLIDRETQQAEYGIGSGVVWDSTSQDEFAETMLKACVLTKCQPQFSLLETMRWTPDEGYFLLEAHLKRLSDSAVFFGYPFDAERIKTHLADAADKLPIFPHRVRLLLDHDGGLKHEVSPLIPDSEDKPLRVKLADQPVDSGDVFLFHKTTHREFYERARLNRPDCDDVLLYNKKAELTESTIANVVLKLDNELVTPPASCDLLAGTFRASLLDQGIIKERVIRCEELGQCTKLYLINSVQGWRPAELV
jgi:para-aminobenzoate synthetase/4-amino-4-deoxychorismate lyase